MPPKALAISAFALAVAALASLWPESLQRISALVWLLALVPSFLLAYHKGWTGGAYGLAGAMALLILLQIVPSWTAGADVDWRITGAITVVLIAGSLGASAIAESLHRERDRALLLAYEDPLTGLPNRRVIDFFLTRHFAAAARGYTLSIVMFDIDGFKAYNDRHGHQAGDEALRLVGRVLATNTRQMDISGRSGGEEFLSVLPGAPASGATVFAERVRQAVARESEDLPEPLTISAGVAGFEPSMEEVRELLVAVDRALYAAKQGGRNRTVTLGEVPAAADIRRA
ncbi:MAG: GGDEF domain-containing protein [Gemmatimonadota bacterium]